MSGVDAGAGCIKPCNPSPVPGRPARSKALNLGSTIWPPNGLTFWQNADDRPPQLAAEFSELGPALLALVRCYN
jgi:hypothetical protein